MLSQPRCVNQTPMFGLTAPYRLTGGATLQAGEQILVLGSSRSRRTAAFRGSMPASLLPSRPKKSETLRSAAELMLLSITCDRIP